MHGGALIVGYEPPARTILGLGIHQEDPDDSDKEDTVESATLDGLAMILADVKGSKLKQKAVVNLSFGVSEDIEDASRDKLHDLIEELLANDVVVVGASGNDRVSNPALQ